MLDLTELQQNLYDIRLLDGTVLQLKRPNQSMIQFLVDIKKRYDASDGDNLALLDSFANFFCRILNRNAEGFSFTEDQLKEDYDYETILYVVNDYFNYWNAEVSESVNFQQDAPQAEGQTNLG